MSRIQVPIVLSEGAKLPTYGTAGAAGVDLCSTIEWTLQPMERALIPTGIRVAIPHGFEGQIRPRSGMAIRQGLSMVNSPGTIDSDYRGEVQVIAINLGQEAIHIQPGDRIAQMVFCPIVQADFEVMESLDDTHRGEGGFGSTGKR